jgi:putative oxidoreductase
MKLGLTVLRATIGAIFFAHGAQKLFGWFGGYGLEATAKGFDSMGLRPGKRQAVIAGAAETGGGALLGLGLLTPVGAAATIGVMDQAVRTVHLKNGFFVTNGGYEFNLILAAAAFALADHGPGPWSLDSKLGLKMSGPLWALGALGAGLAGPKLVAALAPAEAPEAPAPAESAPEPAPATAAQH